MFRSVSQREAGFSRTDWLRAILLVALGCAWPTATSAQVLRIGGFDFNAIAHAEAVYSSNISRIRPGTTTASLEDYYVAVGLDLLSTRQVGQGTTVDLGTGITEEKHFKRTDLDNSTAPFGHFDLRTTTDIGHLQVMGEAGYQKTSQSQSDTFSPQGLGKARDPREIINYGGGAKYEANRLSLGGDYRYHNEAHDLTQFQNQNQSINRFETYIAYRLADRFTPRFTYDTTDTKFPNNSSSDRKQSNKRFVFPVLLVMRPQLTYSFTWQEEDRGDGSPVKWKPRNTVSVGDTIELSRSLTVAYQAMYDNYPQPAQDQVQFTYGASLTHQIGRTATQTAAIQRQPVRTLGSTLQSDETMYSYRFRKSDLFIYNLNLALGASLQHTIPQGDASQPAVDTVQYNASLIYKQDVTRRLSRSLAYEYLYEDQNSVPGKIIEHRVTLSYRYLF